jgi:hypothetical protein
MNILNTSEKDGLAFCVFIEHDPSPGSCKNGPFLEASGGRSRDDFNLFGTPSKLHISSNT